jgi:hypothetical protein
MYMVCLSELSGPLLPCFPILQQEIERQKQQEEERVRVEEEEGRKRREKDELEKRQKAEEEARKSEEENKIKEMEERKRHEVSLLQMSPYVYVCMCVQAAWLGCGVCAGMSAEQKDAHEVDGCSLRAFCMCNLSRSPSICARCC